jgi:hypothetical protein
MQSLRRLPSFAAAARKRSGKIPFDSILNRALKQITIIKNYGEGWRDKEKVDRYMQEAWVIYSRLQRLKNHDHFTHDNSPMEPKRTVTADDMVEYHSHDSANVRSGVERGFAHVKWDNRVWEAQTRKRRKKKGEK